MRLSRRHVLHLSAGALALHAATQLARADSYPSRPVHLIVGFSAGSASDVIARLMAQWLSEHLGQAVVTENRPGAATNLAAENVVNANAARGLWHHDGGRQTAWRLRASRCCAAGHVCF